MWRMSGTAKGMTMPAAMADAKREAFEAYREHVDHVAKECHCWEAGWEAAWNAALEEAAWVAKANAHEECDVAEEIERGIHGLMDRPPPDTGLRDRNPTPEEFEAHEDGIWITESRVGLCRPLRVVVQDGVPYCSRLPGDGCMRGIAWDEHVRWRPVTRELWPAQWPQTKEER